MESSNSDDAMSVPFVSIVIPVRNSPERIKKCIEVFQNG